MLTTGSVTPTDLAPTPTVEISANEQANPKPESSQILVVVLIVAAIVGAGVAVWLIRDPV
jgi:hypothetical protein